MNTNNLKHFAQNARRKLMEQVAARLEYILTADSSILREKARQIEELKKDLQQTGKAQLIERVAYTWFNRLVALRYMDANDYQPSGIRVITPAEGFVLPQALNEAKQGHIPEEWKVNRKHIYDLLDGRIPSTNAQNEVFRELLIAACNHLNTVFPFLFERIDDYTELMLPDDLTSQFSIVHDVVEGMADEDCRQVEVIGWLYQFYISEEKDRLINAKKKYKPTDIAPVTQLFTPNWIVKYMVDNTLGQLWKEIKPNTRLTQSLEFYIKPVNDDLIPERASKSPEEITFFDPCCGSGHILVYAFDLFYKIYEELGYNPSEIPGLIITKNLVGIDIDDRAAQLAGFALMMKGREQYSRFLRKAIIPNIMSLQNIKNDRLFENAKELGSLIKVDQEYLDEIRVDENSLFGSLDKQKKRQAAVLSKKYDLVVTNPPYLNSSLMSDALKEYVDKNYKNSKSDLFASFIFQSSSLTKKDGFIGYISPYVWMFISSYEKVRQHINNNTTISSLIQLEYNAFEPACVPVCTFTLRNQMIKNYRGSYIKLSEFKGHQNQAPKTLEAISNPNCGWFFTANQTDFEKIPGSPIGYWLSEKIIKIFDTNKNLGDFAEAKQGLATANNERFLRYWTEISLNNSSKQITSSNETNNNHVKWYPYNKGGEFKKWYGNQLHVVNWKNKGEEVKNFKNREGKQLSVVRNPKYHFKSSISWSDVTSSKNAFRFYENGFIHDACAHSSFGQDEKWRFCLMAFCNLEIASDLSKLLNPTMHFHVGYFNKLPYFVNFFNDSTFVLSKRAVELSKKDWNSRETSWDFCQNELISLLKQSANINLPLFTNLNLLKTHKTSQFIELHQNEEELNRIFIDIYGLQDELTPDVPLEEITILQQELDRSALAKLNKKLKRDPETLEVLNYDKIELPFDLKEVMAQLVSYAVGCMFGRYSLDKEGLILANQGETLQEYIQKIGISAPFNNHFMPDEDNIIPVLDEDWFEDDISGRFRQFLKVAFGTEHFDENLAFVEQCLGKDVRTYFARDFYPDHIRRYKKRPIYWMFSSPRGAFNVLIYMHRYTPDTASNILNGYLRQYQEKLRLRRQHLQHVQVTGTSAEKTQAIRESDRIDRILIELHEYERDILYPLAANRITIDLDDGVLVNYNRFGKAIKEVSGLNDAATKKKVKAFDWVDTSNII